MSKKISVGIDIGSATIKIIVAEWVKEKQHPVIIGIGQTETQGMKSGYIYDIEKVTVSVKKAVRQAEKSSKIKIKKAFVSIGGINLSSVANNGYSITSKADEEVTKLDTTKAIQESREKLDKTNKKIIHSIPINYKLDGKEIHGRIEGMKGSKLEVKTLFITCSKQNIEDLINIMAELNINIVDILASPVALSLSLLSEKQKMAGCVLLDIGSESVSLAVFEDNLLQSLRVFNIGSNDITKDIALLFKINLDEAENLKTGRLIGDYSRNEMDEIIEARLIDIFELVENHLKRMKRNELLPAGVILSGGGASVKKIEDIAKKQLKIPARVGPGDSSFDKKYKIKNNSWYTVMGLILSSDNNPNNELNSSITDNLKQAKGIFKSFLSQLLP
ncbi:MAG: cell division protein FtsA [Patescibacteria group bacterium]|nr:cell division protein FtsA [Patescibacteria group bacterium]